MPSLYQSGLIARSSLRLEKLRRVPPTGRILVKEGDRVEPSQVVGYLNPQGYLFTINLAEKLSISPFDVPSAMLLPIGTTIRKGEVIAAHRSLFGKQEFASPENGVIESVSPYTGRVTIRSHPLPVNACYPGEIDRIIPGEGVVISTHGALIQGVFGVGGYQQGSILVVTQSEIHPLLPELIKPEHEGCIIAGGYGLSTDSLERARRLGVKGIIVGSTHKSVLDRWLGYSLGTAVTGMENTITLMLTEGFGTVPMLPTTFAILSNLHGMSAYLDGSTRVRAGVIRPELLVPHQGAPALSGTVRWGEELRAGQLVRLIRTPRFGQMAQVVDAEPFLHRLPTEATVLAVKVRIMETRQEVAVPLANLELIG